MLHESTMMDPEMMKQKMAKWASLFPEEKRAILPKIMLQMAQLGKDLKALTNPECIEYVNEKFQFRDTDIILASFPKTGTNWMANIMQRMIFADEMNLREDIPPILFGLDGGDPAKFELMDYLPGKHRFFITHLSGSVLNRKRLKESNAKVIYVLRNPKDQLVSEFNFFRTKPMFSENPEMKGWLDSFDTFFKHGLDGDYPIDGNYSPRKSTYIDHILSWLPEEGDDYIKFVYFEDLKNDFLGELRKVEEFLGIPLNDDQKNEIVEKTSIDYMRKEYAAKKMPEGLINKGGVGGWRDVLSDEQSKEVDKVFVRLQGTGVNFQYTLGSVSTAF